MAWSGLSASASITLKEAERAQKKVSKPSKLAKALPAPLSAPIPIISVKIVSLQGVGKGQRFSENKSSPAFIFWENRLLSTEGSRETSKFLVEKSGTKNMKRGTKGDCG